MAEPYVTFTSSLIPLPAENIDTDQIVPARYLKVTDKAGLAEALFCDWRFEEDGSLKQPPFVLDRPEMAGRRILLVGDNFGTGSSREHAVWAILDYGFEAVVSPRFADIFRNNCTKNGLVPVQVDAETGERLLRAVEADPGLLITIDVEQRTLSAPDAGIEATFPLDDATRERFLKGLDDIGITLQHETAIADYEARRPSWLPHTA